MSEYRTHLQESVAAAVSGLQRLAETLGSEVVDTDSGSAGRHTPASATPSPSKGDVSHPLPSPSPAPSAPAPRRWWLRKRPNKGWPDAQAFTTLEEATDSMFGSGWKEIVPVVEASALEAAERDAQQWRARYDEVQQERSLEREALIQRAAQAEREREKARAEATRARTVTRERLEDAYRRDRGLRPFDLLNQRQFREFCSAVTTALGLEVQP